MTYKNYEQKKLECWEEAVLHGALEVDKDLLFDHAFKCGYALGKQEKDADTVMQGWVARDEDGRIYLYDDEPKRENGKPYGKPSEWGSVNVMTKLSVASFPDLSWSDEPQEVEIIIKRKKK